VDWPTEQNAIVIDSHSPTLETVPTMILQVNSISPSFEIFPYLTSTIEKYKYDSLGVLHFYPKSNPETRVIGKCSTILWQFIDAGAISLKLELN
jgi:hypothetical protein